MARSHSQTDLNLIIDLIADDDRPTIILKSPSRSASSSDASHQTLIQSCTPVVYRNVAFNDFLGTAASEYELHSWILAIPATATKQRVVNIGTFAGREWSSKSLECGWVVISQTTSAVKCQEPEKPAPDDAIVEEDSELRLTDLVVDWIRFPGVTDDPWIRYILDYDWENTALGPINTWPSALSRIAVTELSCPEPRMIFWASGNDLLMLYNAAAVPVLGSLHPSSLGNRLADIWGPAIYEQHAQTIRRGVKEGRAIQIKAMEFVSERKGALGLEEAYFNFHLLPLVSPEGRFLGALNEYTEVTDSVLQANREKVKVQFFENAAKSCHLTELWPGFLAALDLESHDVSYGLVYSVPNPAGSTDSLLSQETFKTGTRSLNYHFDGSFGIPNQTLGAVAPESLLEVFERAQQSAQIIVLQRSSGTLPAELAIEISRGVVSVVCVLPVFNNNGSLLAYVVLGMNPRRPFDESEDFVRSLHDLLSKAATFIHLPEKLEEANVALLNEVNRLHITKVKAEKNEDTFMRMAKNAPIGMYMFDTSGSVRFVNDAYLQLLSMERDVFMEKAQTGIAWFEAIYEEDVEYAKETVREMYENKHSTVFQYRVKVPSRNSAGFEPRWLEAVSFPEVDENGKVVSIQGWLSDISHRKLAESSMAERLQDAIETKRASERFIDMGNFTCRRYASTSTNRA